MQLQVMSPNDMEAIRELFRSVFCAEPWKDDWSNERQLTAYLTDLTANANSLTLGLYEEELIGLSIGHVRHWYEGTEYWIDEFCIRQDRQRKGNGTLFLRMMETELKRREISLLFLLTERNVPAYDFYLARGFAELKNNTALCKRILPAVRHGS